MEISEYLGPPIFPKIRMSDRFRFRYQSEVERWIANFNTGRRSIASDFGDVTIELIENELASNSGVYDFQLSVRLDSLREKNQGFFPDIFAHGVRNSTGKIHTYTMMVSKFVISDPQLPQGTRYDLMLEKIAYC